MPSPLCLVLSRPRVVPHRGACLPDASIVAHLDLRLARGKLKTCWCTIAVPFFTGRGIPGRRAVRSAVVGAVEALDAWSNTFRGAARHPPAPRLGWTPVCRGFVAAAPSVPRPRHVVARSQVAAARVRARHHSLSASARLVDPVPRRLFRAIARRVQLAQGLSARPRWLSAVAGTVGYYCRERPLRTLPWSRSQGPCYLQAAPLPW